jgi:hypothetical protein
LIGKSYARSWANCSNDSDWTEVCSELVTSRPKTTFEGAHNEIFLARHGGPGNEIDDWLKAEVELKEAHKLI